MAHHAIYDLDDMLTHFDVRGPIASEMGKALAKVYDKNVARSIALAARTAADGPFPGGSVITDAALAATAGKYDGYAYIDAIRAARMALYDKDVPEDLPIYCAVNAQVFDAIKFAKDPSGNYVILDRNFGYTNGGGGYQSRPETLQIEDVTIFRTKHVPSTNESADTSVYAKYRADFSNTVGLLWAPMAVAAVKLMDVSMETTRDTRRLEDFMVAKALAGFGTLRPECALELRKA